jgi:hypothetical protein
MEKSSVFWPITSVSETGISSFSDLPVTSHNFASTSK